jgi:hypothetical protein
MGSSSDGQHMQPPAEMDARLLAFVEWVCTQNVEVMQWVKQRLAVGLAVLGVDEVVVVRSDGVAVCPDYGAMAETAQELRDFAARSGFAEAAAFFEESRIYAEESRKLLQMVFPFPVE